MGSGCGMRGSNVIKQKCMSNTRGMKNANKRVLMAALSYNLKKFLKFISRKPNSRAQMISFPKGMSRLFVDCFRVASISLI